MGKSIDPGEIIVNVVKLGMVLVVCYLILKAFQLI
jgi:hypothetical protein